MKARAERFSEIVVRPAQGELCYRAYLEESEPRLHRILAPHFSTWVVITDPPTGSQPIEEPILSLFSLSFLRNSAEFVDQWRGSEREDVLYYMLQQIQQFQRAGSDFINRYQGVEMMKGVSDEMLASVLEGVPLEKRLQGLTADDSAKGLSEYQKKRLIKLLQPEKQPERKRGKKKK